MQWASFTGLDLALGAALSADLTAEAVFLHVGARLEHADELRETYLRADGGTLKGQGAAA